MLHFTSLNLSLMFHKPLFLFSGWYCLFTFSSWMLSKRKDAITRVEGPCVQAFNLGKILALPLCLWTLGNETEVKVHALQNVESNSFPRTVLECLFVSSQEGVCRFLLEAYRVCSWWVHRTKQGVNWTPAGSFEISY